MRLLAVSTLSGWLALWPVPVRAAPDAQGDSLARSVPAEARLFLELRGLSSLSERVLEPVLDQLLSAFVTLPPAVATSQPATTSSPASSSQPVTASKPAQTGWLGKRLSGLRRHFAEAAGLDDIGAELLFTGSLALAADGWSGLGDGVLLVEPVDVAGLESSLAKLRLPTPGDGKVRRYQLKRDHELATDGRAVVIGRPGPSGLYLRTVELWEHDSGACLGDMAEFRARTSMLPAGSQVVFYSGSNSRTKVKTSATGPWWPEGWPELSSLAIGLHLSPMGVTVDANGRRDREPGAPDSSGVPIEWLTGLPASTVLAWTLPVRYVDAYRRIEATDDQGILSGVQGDIPSQHIEEQLLEHLVGDTIVVVGQARADGTSTRPAGERLTLPAVALAVETDDPHAVETMMNRLTASTVRWLDPKRERSASDLLRSTVATPGEERLLSILLGQTYASRSNCPFLKSLEVTWVVADRWLIVGTHAELVGEIVRCRRGESRTLPPEMVSATIVKALSEGAVGESLLVARPQSLSGMIDSWLSYVSAGHAEMLRPSWWQRLRRQESAKRVQLGVLPTPRVLSGAVEVGQTLANYPAHGVLKPGDQITGVDGQALDADRPRESLRQRLAMRERLDVVTLMVVRQGEEINIDVAMGAAERTPRRTGSAQMLRYAANLMRPFQSASYAMWHSSPEILNAHLELRFAETP